jgi:hypothetical protein
MKKGKTKSFTKIKGIEKKKYSNASSMTNIININNYSDSSNNKQQELVKAKTKYKINHEYSKSNILNPIIKSKKNTINKQNNNASIEFDSIKQTRRSMGVYENQIQKENANINNNKTTQLEKKPNCLLLPNKNNKTSFCFMTKERKLKLIKGIMLPLNNQKYITKERKKITDSNNNNINSILLPLKEISFIEKVRKKENMNQIKTIQNIFKIKKNKDDVKNIKNKPCYNNEEKSACLPRIKNYYKTIDSSDYSNEDIEKDNYFLNGYISKIYKRIVYKHPLKDICHISKKSLINKKKNNEAPKKNYSFLSLMDFFIKKNVQEYVYPKLPLDKIYKNRNNKNNKNKKADSNKYNFDSNKNPIDENLVQDDKFTYPKYYKTLKRLYNFYKTKKRGESPRAKKLYDEILPDIETSKSLNDLITKLNDEPDKNKKLIDNLDKNENNKIDDKDYINEMG